MNKRLVCSLAYEGASMTNETTQPNVTRFPVEKRRNPVLAGAEEALRARWNDVLTEPIPGHLLAVLSRLERMERESEERREPPAGT